MAGTVFEFFVQSVCRTALIDENIFRIDLFSVIGHGKYSAEKSA